MKNKQSIIEGEIYNLISLKNYKNEWVNRNKLIYVFYANSTIAQFEYLDFEHIRGISEIDDIRVKPYTLINDLTQL